MCRVFPNSQNKKSPSKDAAKPNPNKESQRHAKKAISDTRVENAHSEITTNKSRYYIDHITTLEERKCRVKTGLLASSITTHAKPKVAQVYNVTVHNQPAAKEEVEGAKTIGKADNDINNTTINNLKIF